MHWEMKKILLTCFIVIFAFLWWKCYPPRVLEFCTLEELVSDSTFGFDKALLGLMPAHKGDNTKGKIPWLALQEGLGKSSDKRALGKGCHLSM